MSHICLRSIQRQSFTLRNKYPYPLCLVPFPGSLFLCLLSLFLIPALCPSVANNSPLCWDPDLRPWPYGSWANTFPFIYGKGWHVIYGKGWPGTHVEVKDNLRELFPHYAGTEDWSDTITLDYPLRHLSSHQISSNWTINLMCLSTRKEQPRKATSYCDR